MRRRFERLGQTPVLVRELAVDGATITTTVDGELATTRLASPEEAQRSAEQLAAEWRAAGFIPINRIAAVAPEEPVRRRERRAWGPEYAGQVREIEQRDEMVRVKGQGKPEVHQLRTIQEASALFDRLLADIDAEIARDEARAKRAEVRAEERKAKRAQAKRERRVAEYARNQHPVLEAECRTSPDAPGPWLVYADWLITHDDPIGEAAALALAGNEDAATALLLRNFEELLGVTFRLEHGFIRHVALRRTRDYETDNAELPAWLKTVLLAPCCRFVDSIRLGLASFEPDGNSWGESLEALVELPHAPGIRELLLDDYTYADCEISWTPYGNLAFAWPKLPALEVLKIRAGGDGELGTLDLPRLRSFTRESGGLRRHDVDAICALARPHLEALELWTGSTNYAGEIELDHLRPILDARGVPRLAHLGIVNSELSDELIPALAASRVLPQLTSLDLSRGIFARAATDALIANAAQFRHLASIDLSRNLLYEAEIEEIRAVLDNVIVTDQRDDREDDYPGDPGDRYVDVGE